MQFQTSDTGTLFLQCVIYCCVIHNVFNVAECLMFNVEF